MRIIEPNKRTYKKPKRSKSSYLSTAFVLVAFASIIFYLSTSKVESPVVDESLDFPDTVNPVKQDKKTSEFIGSGLLEFSGNEFRIFYDNLLQPNLDKVDIPPVISGNEVADGRIRQIAESRGYRLRSNPTKELSTIQGFRLQEPVHDPWLALQAGAALEGHNISIVSAFRSVSVQRSLFLSRLNAEGVSISDVEAGKADAEIDEVLVTTAIPGYSKHHTGYTIDLLCAGYAFENFENSSCNAWLAADNYKNAKTYGFIPSYPIGADLQGPDPEAWEYVYVGNDQLRI